MKKSFVSFFFILFVICSLEYLFSGDVSNFVGLGFSRNYSYFTFAQYGYEIETQQAYASIVTVDIKKNEFLQGSGLEEKRFYVPKPGDGGFPDGILYLLIEKYAPIRLKFGIDYTYHGRLLYVNSVVRNKMGLLDGDKLPNNGHKPCDEQNRQDQCYLNFDDSKLGFDYRVVLKKEVRRDNEKKPESTLRLDLTVQFPSGVVKTYHVGHPTFVRKGVVDYQIDSVILAPDEKGLIFVIAKKFDSENGFCVRYMVETVVL